MANSFYSGDGSGVGTTPHNGPRLQLGDGCGDGLGDGLGKGIGDASGTGVKGAKLGEGNSSGVWPAPGTGASRLAPGLGAGEEEPPPRSGLDWAAASSGARTGE